VEIYKKTFTNSFSKNKIQLLMTGLDGPGKTTILDILKDDSNINHTFKAIGFCPDVCEI
jgi:adenylylsulfate kinase-like enzyme